MILRVARPTDRLKRIATMYRDGLGFQELASFENHEGFDGVVLGHPRAPYHLEFTHHRGTTVGNAPSEDNLLVFYIPETAQWSRMCKNMEEAGFTNVASYNPYWDVAGKTYEDPDGYRVVLQNRAWTA